MPNQYKVPLFSLDRQYQPFTGDILKRWLSILESQNFTSGQEVGNFEQNFSLCTKTKHAIAIRSGTAALIVALKALGIGLGDEVITSPCTFAATADAISLVGATPVFVDVEPTAGNIDSENIAAAISPKTKAILVVHLYGVMANMSAILKIAKKHKLKVIEDASHAHGSQLKTAKGTYRAAGAWGDVGCFSLYPSKTLGAAGNAGVITTDNLRLAKKIRATAHHGIVNADEKYKHDFPGYNELIDTIQAAVLNIKMPHLVHWIARREMIACRYNEVFRKYGFPGMQWNEVEQQPSLYVFALQVKSRNRFRAFFKERKIETGLYYPIPLHLQKSYQNLGYKKGALPNAEKFFNQTVSLPLYPELTDEEVSHVCKVIEEYCQQSSKSSKQRK